MSALDPEFRIAAPASTQSARPAGAALGAAVLLHVAVLLALLPRAGAPPRAPVPVIVATLVREPPPPAPVPAATPPEPLAARASGPDANTTAPPPAPDRATKPQSAPPPAAAPAAVAPPTAAAEAPLAAPASAAAELPPAAAPPRAEIAGLPPEKPKPAALDPGPRRDRLAAREPMPQVEDRAIGERAATGDPYLNALWSRIEAQRAPTTPVGASGLHLEGIATWRIVIDRDGSLEQMDLERSSGSPLLDAETRRMIVAAAPFPAVPRPYPDRVPLTVTIRLYPR